MLMADARIIPAYAGNTATGPVPVCPVRGSSPHTRGTQALSRATCRHRGDHPRIRGEHDGAGELRDEDGGIIPAYAGNTKLYVKGSAKYEGSSPHTRGTRCRENSPAACARDHPRIRGEHRHRREHHRCQDRIIPAYAGNTTARACTRWFARDHPRIRGEHSIPLRFAHCRRGSSPHTRGTLRWYPFRFLVCCGSSPHTRGTPTAIGLFDK